jgi:hypothetical protein
MPQCASDTEKMDNTERPSVASMRKHFSLQPIIIVTESITSCLRLSHHCIEV